MTIHSNFPRKTPVEIRKAHSTQLELPQRFLCICIIKKTSSRDLKSFVIAYFHHKLQQQKHRRRAFLLCFATRLVEIFHLLDVPFFLLQLLSCTDSISHISSCSIFTANGMNFIGLWSQRELSCKVWILVWKF